MAGSRCKTCDHPRINEINKMLVENKKSQRFIASQFGLRQTSVQRHAKSHLPKQLQRAVDRRVKRAEDEVLKVAISGLEERLKAQQDRWDRMKAVIERRAAGMVFEDGSEECEGTGTGLLVRKVKNVDGDVVHEYAVDTGLLKEMRELERQVSQETGQFGETGPGKGSGPVVVIVQPYIDHSSDVEIPKIAVLGQRDEPIAVLPEPDEAIEVEFEDVLDLESAPGAKNVPESAPGAKTQEPEPPDGDYF